MSSIEGPEDLEARLGEFSDGIGLLVQEFVTEVGLEEVIGAITIEMSFFKPQEVQSATDPATGITSCWTAPGFLDEVSEYAAQRDGADVPVGHSEDSE
jgi:hypothetical protein